MTVDGLGSGPGGLSISQLCFCLLEAEDPRERRQPAAPASQPGAQSSALPPQAAHPRHSTFGEQGALAPGYCGSPASQGTQIRSAVLRLKGRALLVPAHLHAARESAAIWGAQLGLASPPGPWPYPPRSAEKALGGLVLEEGLTY